LTDFTKGLGVVKKWALLSIIIYLYALRTQLIDYVEIFKESNILRIKTRIRVITDPTISIPVPERTILVNFSTEGKHAGNETPEPRKIEILSCIIFALNY
jgi:hypothetical protein